MITILQVKKGGHKVLTWEDEKFKAFIENKNPIDVETTKDVWGWVRLKIFNSVPIKGLGSISYPG